MPRARSIAGGIGLLVLMGAAWGQSLLQREIKYNVPRQPLNHALNAFAEQSGLRIVFYTDAAEGVTSNALTGSLTPESALKILLGGSELKYWFTDEHTVAIDTVNEAGQPSAGAAALESSRLARASERASILQPVTDAQSSRDAAGSTDTSSDKVQEIIVTAQKRTERLQDVPVPVTAISADTLLQSNQLRIEEYATMVPGLRVTTGIQSSQLLTIRGLNSGGGNPTAGLVFDDVPITTSTGNGGGSVAPDIDPADLMQIELLRGPQGTLYGANSLGGLLKLVAVDPSTERASGRVQTGVTSVHNGDELGYNVRGSFNLPVSDSFAVRASGFTRREPGYIDNPVLGREGVNEQRVSGGRVSALWMPSDTVSVRASALYQDYKGDGSNVAFVLPGLGELQQNNILDAGGYEREIQAYNVRLKADLGKTELTAISGYSINESTNSFDASYLLGGTMQAVFGVPGANNTTNIRAGKFSQEFRLLAAIGPKIEWLLGAFYTHESTRYNAKFLAVDATTGRTVVEALIDDFPTTYTEYAGFTDFTYHFTDRFDVQIGARESHMGQTYTETRSGPFGAGFFIPQLTESANAFTYLVTPRLRVSPNLMMYARFASGYRAGGPNIAPLGTVPPTFDPDKTNNYEIGAKGGLFDRKLSFDASVYYIDWQDIQINLLNLQTFSGYTANGSGAKSQGAELSIEVKPVRGLTIAGWAVWNDAVLTEPFPVNSPLLGRPGDRLPLSSRVSGNFSLEQQFPLGGVMTGYIGGLVRYVGQNYSFFTANGQRVSFPAYTTADVRAGVSYDTWSLGLYVQNVTDKRAMISGGEGDFPPFGFVYIKPRMIGLNIAKEF